MVSEYSLQYETTNYVAYVAIFTITTASILANESVRSSLVFAYNCFIRPLGKVTNQTERLDKFYRSQANVYDYTRSKLLRGRCTMLKLCAAQLYEAKKKNPQFNPIWVDIGGGTGWNIEEMDKYFSISEFSQIYLIDLCEPLLEVSRRRFSEKGFHNVQVLCQDASTFSIPDLPQNGKVDLFTFSYSISMIPQYYAALDRVNESLDSNTGIVGVADFYVSDRSYTSDRDPFTGGAISRQCGVLSRWFWKQWFSLDHVDLHPGRRDYLEHKFGTIKCFNGRNQFIIPFLVQIPYYIWLGVSRNRDTSAAINAFEIEAGNRTSIPPSFPDLSRERLLSRISASPQMLPSSGPVIIDLNKSEIPAFSLNYASPSSSSSSSMSRTMSETSQPPYPMSSFHYQKKQWRVPFVDNDFSDTVRTWIYGFTWEDPHVDMQHLDLKESDEVLCITSAGDNALHYAAAASPARVHAVDMNPCQGHLLELKLACLASLDYDSFWRMFGEGKIDNFRTLLDSRISPYLSSHAYQFWKTNADSFDDGFYYRGYSGLALRWVRTIFSLMRVRKHVRSMCMSDNLDDQITTWKKHVRRAIINKPLIKCVFENSSFLWNALGVPVNQFSIFMDEGTSVEQFAIDTLDSIPSRSLFKNDNYHYHLCLMGSYTRESCPLYLKQEIFQRLQEDSCKALESFRLHTDSIVNVLRGLEDRSLTRAVLMDHMDWFDKIPDDTPIPTLAQSRDASNKVMYDLDREITELKRVISPGGYVFWRSAAKRPWYNKRFEKMGFTVEVVSVRETGSSIDAVNMYASFYKAIRV